MTKPIVAKNVSETEPTAPSPITRPSSWLASLEPCKFSRSLICELAGAVHEAAKVAIDQSASKATLKWFVEYVEYLTILEGYLSQYGKMPHGENESIDEVVVKSLAMICQYCPQFHIEVESNEPEAE